MQRRDFLLTSAAAALSTGLRAAEPRPNLRVAVIGHTGRGNYGHGLDTMWLDLPDVEVVGVADPDPKGLAAAQTKFRGVAGFADYRKMLAETKPDIVAIAMRFVDEHHAVALAACEAEVRGIYCEKSFCRTPAEADEIVAACREKNVKLAIAHRNRYHPVLPVIKKLVEAGTIGTLLELRGRGKEDQRGGGLDLHVLGSHVLNLANYFGGKPKSCSASVYQDRRLAVPRDVVEGAEGIGPLVGNELHARYEMENGVPLFFDSIQHAGIKAANFGLQLVGNAGIIDLRVDVEPLAQLCAGNPTHPTKEPRTWVPISSAGVGKPEPIANLGRDIASHRLAGLDLIEAIHTGREPLCNVREGQVVMEMINAVFESHVNDGKRIALPSKTRASVLAGWK